MRACDCGFSLIELLLALGVAAVVGAIAVPMMGTSLGSFRLSGDARSLKNSVSLAKMQAAANFTQARVYVDLAGGGFRIETWQKTGTPAWVAQSGITYLSSRTETYGFGSVSSPPPDAQAAIAQAPACLDAGGQAIGNTACILFNSRGIPVDSSGAPTAAYALYLTDGAAVFGTTVSATSVIRLWRANAVSTPNWVVQ